MEEFDSFALDPSTAASASWPWTRGPFFNVDALTGASAGNPSFDVAPDTNWGSLGFDGSGNLYVRNALGPSIRSWTRSGTAETNGKPS